MQIGKNKIESVKYLKENVWIKENQKIKFQVSWF